MRDMKILIVLLTMIHLSVNANDGKQPYTELYESIKFEKLEADPALLRSLMQKVEIETHHDTHKFFASKATITATISGTVTESDGGSNLAGYTVRLLKYDSPQQNFLSLSSTSTGAAGDYTFNITDSGIYAVTLGEPDDSDNYFSYVWNVSTNSQQLCSGCNLDSNTHGLDLSSNITINNINFNLDSGGSIQGNLVDADTLLPVPTLSVELFNVDQTIPSYTLRPQINPTTGDFIFRGVPDGNYIAYLSPSDENNMYIPEIFGGPRCNSCFNLVLDGIGSVLSISGANTLTGTDFHVNLGSSISGSLVAQNNLLPAYHHGAVYLFNELNQLVSIKIIYGTEAGPLATDGSYFFGGLLKGSYFIQGGDLGTLFYQRELFDNIPCPYSGCDRRNGTPIHLGPSQHVIEKDIRLDLGGKIDGYIVDRVTAGPLNAIDFDPIEFQVYDLAGNVAGAGSVINPSTGYFILSRAIAPGQYKLKTGNMFNGRFNEPYIEKLHVDEDCPGMSCDLTGQGSEIEVLAENITEAHPMELYVGNSFSGLITELGSANPIAGVNVLAYTASNPPKFAAWSTTDSNGNFTIYGLPDGDYYLLTNDGSNLPFAGIHGGTSSGWIDILYNGIACPGGTCDFTTGDIITLPLTPPPLPNTSTKGATPDIFLNLVMGATISGKVIDFESGAPIQEVTVNIYDNTGLLVSSHTTNSLGDYKSAGLPAGTYYLTTNSYDVIVDEIYGGGYCFESDCNPLSGTPIVLTNQQTATGYDFSLRPDFIFSNGMD